MCISTPKPPDGDPPPPTNLVADALQLGSDTIQQRQAGQIGRAALTVDNTRARRPKAPTTGAATPGQDTSAPSPAGTLGLPTTSTGLPVYRNAGAPQ